MSGARCSMRGADVVGRSGVHLRARNVSASPIKNAPECAEQFHARSYVLAQTGGRLCSTFIPEEPIPLTNRDKLRRRSR